MDAETQRQILDLTALRDDHDKRLYMLLRQAAKNGRSTPAEVLIEIDEIQGKIASITADITKLYLAQGRREERQAKARSSGELSDISYQVSNATDAIKREVHGLYVLLLDSLESDSELRRRRQQVVNAFYAAVLFLLVVDIVVRFIR